VGERVAIPFGYTGGGSTLKTSRSRCCLFFPSYLGSGFGHVSRCLALAEELHRRGWQIHFSLAGPHADKVRQSGYAVYEPRLPYRPKAKENNAPAYTIFSDMNFQIVRDRFHSPRIVRATIREGERLVKRIQPDVLVGDTWPLTALIARRTGLPVVQIIKSVVHPAHPVLIWWGQQLPGLISPDVRPVYNPVLARWRMPLIDRAEDLLVGDLLLVPSIPELDPLPEGLPTTHYVGPLIQTQSIATSPPNWLIAWSTDHPLVYATLGGGADPVAGVGLFRVLYKALADLPVRVVASTGTRVQPTSLPPAPKNFIVRSWVPGLAVIARSAVVLFHGGYGTMMEAVHHGVPSLIIPFHSEQEANGRRLEASGVGIVIPHSTGPYTPVKIRWRRGSFSPLVSAESTIRSSGLRNAVHRLLSEEPFRRNAARLREELANYGGPLQAAELLEDLVT
jgi:UDP:flavonoid glycosyltransferase YjiC (YdhE family)